MLMELCDGGCVATLLRNYGAFRWNIVARSRPDLAAGARICMREPARTRRARSGEGGRRRPAVAVCGSDRGKARGALPHRTPPSPTEGRTGEERGERERGREGGREGGGRKGGKGGGREGGRERQEKGRGGRDGGGERKKGERWEGEKQGGKE